MIPIFLNLYLYFFELLYYNNFQKTERMFVRRKDVYVMDKRQDLINRIEKLTDEQFEMLIFLLSQRGQEFAPSGQVENQTSQQLAV